MTKRERMILNYIRWITNSMHLWCTCALWHCRTYFRFSCVYCKIVFPWASLILKTSILAENVRCISSVSHRLQISIWLSLTWLFIRKLIIFETISEAVLNWQKSKMKSISISIPHSLPNLFDIRLVRLRW